MNPLLHAFSGGSLEAAQFLMSKGVKLNITDKEGRTALHCAAYGGHDHCLRFLIEQVFCSHFLNSFQN
jgi:ankyrin repeat protein